MASIIQYINYTKTRPVKSPMYSTLNSAGIDFYIPDDYPSKFILPHSTVKIPMGIKFKFSHDCVLIGFNKSGVATNKNLILLANVVDQDYEGELFVSLHNVGETVRFIEPGEKIAQMILLKRPSCVLKEIKSVEELYKDSISERGEGALVVQMSKSFDVDSKVKKFKKHKDFEEKKFKKYQKIEDEFYSEIKYEELECGCGTFCENCKCEKK